MGQATINTTKLQRGKARKPLPKKSPGPQIEQSWLGPAHRLFYPALVAILTMCILFATCGWSLHVTLDEGIYLTGASQVAQGLTPYKDFFALTGPGVYWLYGLIFKCFGPYLAAAHLCICCEIGIVTSLLFSFVRSVTKSYLSAAVVAGFFVATIVNAQYRLYVNHRWDSAFCSVLAASFATYGIKSRMHARFHLVLAGAAAGMAVVFTPTLIGVPIAIAVFLLQNKNWRSRALPFGIGVTAILAVVLALLAEKGAFGQAVSMWEWNRSHYSAANKVYFGYFDIQTKASSFWSGAYIGALIVALAPTLTVITAFGCLALAKLKRISLPPAVVLTAFVGLALVIGTYPRMAANQIAFAMPLLLVPIAWSSSIQSMRFQRIASSSAAVLTCFLILNTSEPRKIVTETALGSVLCTFLDHRIIEDIQNHTIPGENILVYPYLPILYSSTGTRPVSYYSYLQPGMMDAADEERVIEDCRRASPALVIWRRLEKHQIDKIWPNTNWAHAGFPRLEAYIENHFHKLPSPKNYPVEYWIRN